MLTEHKLELISDKLDLAMKYLEFQDLDGASKLYDDCIKLTNEILEEIKTNKVTKATEHHHG